MNQLSNRALMMYFIAAGILFGTWVAIEFNRGHVPHPDQLIGYIQNTLAALAGHIFTLINSSAPSIPVSPPSIQIQAPSIAAPTLVTKE